MKEQHIANLSVNIGKSDDVEVQVITDRMRVDASIGTQVVVHFRPEPGGPLLTVEIDAAGMAVDRTPWAGEPSEIFEMGWLDAD